MMRRRFVAVATAAVLGTVAFGSSGAEAAQRLSRHTDWSVYVMTGDQGRVCYAMTEPLDKAPNNLDHGEVALLVATWASGQAREQVMFHVGYPMRLSGPTRARVGSDRFKMFADGQDAFVVDADERPLVRAMKAGATMRVEAFSQRDNATAYEFSLKGVTAALRAVDQAC